MQMIINCEYYFACEPPCKVTVVHLMYVGSTTLEGGMSRAGGVTLNFRLLDYASRDISKFRHHLPTLFSDFLLEIIATS
jgi:hypothetical protein